jgi:diaminopimelate decarboxylase
MQLDIKQIAELENRFATPFYIFDEQAFRRNFEDITAAFSSRYEKFLLAYSYKTNYVPYLCRIVRDMGGWPEVVSRMEYDLALKVGQQPNRIVFNGPAKSYDDIALAIDNESIVNLDSWSELEHVIRYAKSRAGRKVKIGLRINIGLSDEAGVSHIQQSLKVGRFGFDPDAENIRKVIAALAEQPNIVISSLHGHTSTTDRSIWCYKVITETLCSVAAAHSLDDVEYVNIGGGIFGHIPKQMQWAETPSFDDYAKVACNVLVASEWVQQHKPTLVLEPGVAMVADTLSFVTKVVAVKDIRGKLFVTVDGSALHTKPTLHTRNQPYTLLHQSAEAERGVFNVVGSTCMEKDYLLTDITDTVPRPGDYLVIGSVGAYTIVMSPPFINVYPPILVKDSDDYRVIRRRGTLDGMFADYDFGK